MLPLAIGTTLVAALAGGASWISGTQLPYARNDADVAKVCQAIRTLSSVDQTVASRLVRRAYHQTPATPRLPWPPLPHEVLGIDIFGPPFSFSRPPNNDYPAWEALLNAHTAAALEPWLALEKGNKELHDAISIASLCLRRPALLFVYRKMVDMLTVGWWRWGPTVTLDSEKRWDMLSRMCGWVKEG